MCCLFGLMDFDSVLSTHRKNKILSVLSQESEARGTDATGIAYNFGGKMRIYKRPVPAHRLHIRVPNGVNIIMGHTRMTTQGDAKNNYNNHPFPGCCGGKKFALAHNGTLWNDKELQEKLPKTNIKTDSYVAVQLLEQSGTLDFSSLKDMAETVEGSFTFTVLDADNNLYVVKGDNPFAIGMYKGLALYASTDIILEKAIFLLKLEAPDTIYTPEEGDILKIDNKDRITSGIFTPQTSYSHWWRERPYYGQYGLYDDPFGRDNLIEVGKAMGISPDEIQVLFDYGCTHGEIEELIYNPKLLHDLACELLYAY